MASASILLSEEQFLCSICLDVFTDPVSTPCGHNYCKTCITHYWDSNDECRCPLCQTIFCTRPDILVNTFISEMADKFRKSKQLNKASSSNQDPAEPEKKAELEAELQQMIQERREKIQEVTHSVELCKKDADGEMAYSVQVFTALISWMQRSQAELIDEIEEKQKTTEKQAEGFIKDLQQEITEIKKRSSELKQRSHTEDHLHFLHNFPSINTPPPTQANVHPSSYVETVRTALKTLGQEMEKKLRDAELRMNQQYAVDVTLDPDTAHCELILSKDGKTVSHGDWKKLPYYTERFSVFTRVLGKQSFSGRSYYEVQVKGKTRWSVGVARESVNRELPQSPNNGYWSIQLRNGYEYVALADPPVLLPVRENVQKVGVFVDYEEGLVSFYDVEARVHLYSFTGCTFHDKLFPILNPGFNDGGKNSAPLMISPVSQID